MENNENKKLENWIGVLLVVPIYMFIFSILFSLHLLINIDYNGYLFLPILMYGPIIAGIVLSYKHYKEKLSKAITTTLITFMSISFVSFACTYFTERVTWNGLLGMFMWLGTAVLSKIFSCILYSRIVGWKKTLLFLGSYLIAIILYVTLNSLHSI